MPKLSKYRSLSRINAHNRWYDYRVSRESEDSSNDGEMMTSDVCETHSVSFADEMTVYDIGDLFELVKKKMGVKIPTVLLFMALQYFGVSWVKCNEFFKNIGASTAETAHKWANVFLLNNFD